MTDRRSARQLRRLSLDAVTVEVVRRLRDFGVEPILLKGRSIAERLYPEDPGERTYRDVDLLVAPEHQEIAAYALSGLGFDLLIAGARPAERCPHAVSWTRQGPYGRTIVELHSTIAGPEVPPARVWAVLSGHTTTMALGSTMITVLDDPAMAMYAVLHLAQHGHREQSPLIDLERALSRFDQDVFDGAAQLAGQLAAEAAFAVGLLLCAQARPLVQRYAYAPQITRTVATRSVGGSRGVDSIAILADTEPLRRPVVVLQRLFPSPATLRRSAPLARRGRLGLALAYLIRPLWMLIGLPAALLSWRNGPSQLMAIVGAEYTAGRSAGSGAGHDLVAAGHHAVAHLDQPVAGA